MSQAPSSPDSADGLQFTTAEPAAASGSPVASGQQCVVCRQPIVSTFYAVGDKLLCPNCRGQLTAPAAGSSVGRLVKAALMGFGAGLVGALIWFAIRRVTNYEIGLVAILLGYMVGKAVFKGSGNRGGRAYQVLAVLLTYCCIAINYMPDIVEHVLRIAREERAAAVAADQPVAGANDKPAGGDGEGAAPNNDAAPTKPKQRPSTGEFIGAVALFAWEVFKLSLALPFLSAKDNIIELLIIGFALWEAWKFTAHRQLPITGPYQLGPQPAT